MVSVFDIIGVVGETESQLHIKVIITNTCPCINYSFKQICLPFHFFNRGHIYFFTDICHVGRAVRRYNIHQLSCHCALGERVRDIYTHSHTKLERQNPVFRICLSAGIFRLL